MTDWSSLRYIDTRGVDERILTASQVVLEGTTASKGLWIPEEIPRFSPKEVTTLRGKSHIDVTFAVLERFGFIGGEDGIPSKEAKELIENGYNKFYRDNPFEIVKAPWDRTFFNNLHHGWTMAFKDYALSLLGEFAGYLLEKQGFYGIAPGATSGDTGPAGMANVASDNLFVLVLYPDGGTSEGQEKQMVYLSISEIRHAYAMKGMTFDDCQAMIKALFNDQKFLEEMLGRKVKLLSINSINWFRIAAQTAYMFYTSLSSNLNNGKLVHYIIPSGNSGHWVAAYYAKMMGAPIGEIRLATNKNDILARFINFGEHYPKGSVPTLAPAMDIDVSSNLERFLSHNFGEDNTRKWMVDQKGHFHLKEDSLELEVLQAYLSADTALDEDIKEEMVMLYDIDGTIIDPHTATATSVLDYIFDDDKESNVVLFSTAHPMKFLDTIGNVLGKEAVKKVLDSIPGDQLNILQMEDYTLKKRRSLEEFDIEGLKRIIRNIK